MTKPQTFDGDEVEITQQTVAGASSAHERLLDLGKRLSPDGYEYVGSFACHVYRTKRDDGSFDSQFRTQDVLRGVSPEEANAALYVTSNAIAESFGRQRSKKQQSEFREE